MKTTKPRMTRSPLGAVTATYQRRRNRGAVLRAVAEHGPLPRTALARLTQLSQASISRLVDELIALRLVRENAGIASGAGRPAARLEIDPGGGMVVGIHLGGREAQVVLIDLRGTIQASSTRRYADEETPEGLLGRLREDARCLIKDVGGAAPVLGVGLGSVGLVHPERGVVLDLPRLGWTRVPLREVAEQLFDLPAEIDSGVRNTALAEAWFGAGQTARSVLLLLAGSVVNTAFVVDRHVHRGTDFADGQIGHLQVDPAGPRCECGRIGCVESIASVPALEAGGKELVRTYPHGILAHLVGGDAELVSAEILRAAAVAGDPAVLRLIARRGHALGRAVAPLVSALNPEVVVVAGTVPGGELQLASIRAGILGSVGPGHGALRLLESPNGSLAAPVGAGTLILRAIFEPPFTARSELADAIWQRIESNSTDRSRRLPRAKMV